MNLFLYGPPGSGKSTVGPLLAERRGVPCIDIESEIEQRFRRISDIIKARGINYFQEYESNVLCSITENLSSGCVIVLGGGTLLLKENRTLIHQTQGRIVTLEGNWSTLWERMDKDKELYRRIARTREAFFDLMRDRAWHYQEFFPRISIDKKSPDQVVDDILSLYN